VRTVTSIPEGSGTATDGSCECGGGHDHDRGWGCPTAAIPHGEPLPHWGVAATIRVVACPTLTSAKGTRVAWIMTPSLRRAS
jgi:hypothetical protein